jgi:hypothetical protein
VSRFLATSIAIAVALALGTSDAGAHLFHKLFEPPQTQLTRDTRLLQLLLDDPTERFELARQVWAGTTRVRLKPGGFRRWLVRPNEPGMVFKADYQLNRWSGSLAEEAARIDRQHATTLKPRIDAALAGRDRDGVKRGLREMYVVLMGELLESLWQHLDDAETATRLYGYVLGYYAVNLEGYLNIHQPVAATTGRTALEAIGRAIGDAETGAPAAPEAFDQQRRRFMRVIAALAPLPSDGQRPAGSAGKS